MIKEKVCILTGPTAIGKTKRSLKIAENINGEIISADSMQIYKNMNIGTAKANEEERRLIKHHLIDFVEIDEDYSVADYSRDCRQKIEEINKSSKIPIIVGGTGLYINSIVYNLKFSNTRPNYKLREKYTKIAKKYGNTFLHEKLKYIDPYSYKNINPNDIKRVIRALEVYEETKIPMSKLNMNFREENKLYKLSMICLTMDRDKLYDRINLRVDQMISQGLLDEVKSILDSGYSPDLKSLQGIGYKELIQYLEGHLTFDESIELIKRKSRNYAKRQLTWFRRDSRYKWFNIDNYDNEKDLIEDILVTIKQDLT